MRIRPCDSEGVAGADLFMVVYFGLLFDDSMAVFVKN